MFSFISVSFYGTSIPQKVSIVIEQDIFLQKNWGYSCEALRNDKKSFDSTTELWEFTAGGYYLKRRAEWALNLFLKYNSLII